MARGIKAGRRLVMKKSVLTSKIKCVLFNLDELIPPTGVKEALPHLDLPYAVVSISSRASIAAQLSTAGLHVFFAEDRIFNSSGQMQGGKESGSLIFLHAVRSMGFEPAECVVVDKSETGLDLAMNEDFYVLGRNEDSNKTDFENKGILLFNEFSDLPEIIELFNEEACLERKQ